VRIALNALVAAPELAGDRVYCEQLLRGLVAADGEHEYFVFARRDAGLPPLPADRFRVVHTPVTGASTFRRAIWEFGSFGEEVARRGADLVHGLGGRTPPVRGRPFVLTIHDLIYRQFPESVSFPKRLFMRLVQPCVARRADRVIVPSQSTAELVVRLLGVRENRIRLVPLGPGHAFGPAPGAEEIQSVLATLGCRPPYVISVCRGYTHKNVAGLVKSFARLRDLGLGGVQLVLVGDIHQAGRLVRRIVCELGVGRDVVFTGFVRPAELQALYSGAAVFAFPSLAEGFGMPVLEAMACGAPVVASDVAAVAEVVGGAGVLAPAGDPPRFAEALARVLGDEPLRAELRAKGLARAREFTWDRCATATLAVYRELA
jgi:glycosyltransferase involved in cell wall biosynthesis